MSKLILPIKRSEDQETADFFLALANDSRQRIINLLKKEPDLSVIEISEKANVSIQRISDHLGVLRREKILEFRKAGRQVRYHVKPGKIKSFYKSFLQMLNIDTSLLQEAKGSIEPSLQLKLLRLFSSSGRLSIIRLISNESLTINAIRDKVFLEQQTVSDHIGLLRKANVIIAKKEGRFVRCSLNKKRVAAILDIFLQF